jgi:hypothetical protein
VLSDPDVEEQKENLGLSSLDDESETEAVVDLLDVSVLFQPLPKDLEEPSEDECAIILKSGRTIWIKTPFKVVKERHGVAVAKLME